MIMKLAQNICSNDIFAEFENGSSPLKNMATTRQGSFPFMAIVKPFEHSRIQIALPNHNENSSEHLL